MAHVLALRRSPYFTHPVLDAETYHRAALSLVRGEGYPDPVFWQPPGYPYFLALLYALGGPGTLLPRLVQAVTGSLSAVLTYAIGFRLFGRQVALGAGLGAALYGLLIYYDGELLTPSLGICLQLLAVYLAIRAHQSATPRGWLAAGLFAGLTAVVNATALILLPVMAVFARRRALWLLLGAALAIAPVSARNWLVGTEPILISSNAGVNLFVGNNPRYDETVRMRPGRDWQALLRAPRLHGVHGPRAASRFFVTRVLDFARSDPGAFLRLQLKKLRLLVGGNEIPRNQEIYPARAYSPVLGALVWKVRGLAFPFGLLLPLGVIGLGIGARRAPMLAALLGALAVGVLGFFITARYRAPLVPLLLVFAAEGVRWWVTDASGRGRVIAMAVALPLLVLANWGQGPMPTRMNPDAELGLGVWLEREGQPQEAVERYRGAIRVDPMNWDAWHELGAVLTRLGRREEAAAAYARARAIVPQAFDTLSLVADELANAGCFAEAADHARRAVEIEPRDTLVRGILRRAEEGEARLTGAPQKGTCAPVKPLRLPPDGDQGEAERQG